MSSTSAHKGGPSAWSQSGREVKIEKERGGGVWQKGRKEKGRETMRNMADEFIRVSGYAC